MPYSPSSIPENRSWATSQKVQFSKEDKLNITELDRQNATDLVDLILQQSLGNVSASAILANP